MGLVLCKEHSVKGSDPLRVRGHRVPLSGFQYSVLEFEGPIHHELELARVSTQALQRDHSQAQSMILRIGGSTVLPGAAELLPAKASEAATLRRPVPARAKRVIVNRTRVASVLSGG
jgi:hypothetical protein